MPENQGADECHIEMSAVDLAGVSTSVLQATLKQRPDLAGGIAVLGDDWITKLFLEAWSALPTRLASLAIRPPSRSYLLVRDSFASSQVTQRLPIGERSFALWRQLVELAKSGSRIEVQSIPIEWTSPASKERAIELQERSFPELLSSPPRHELDWLFGELKLARLSDLCGDVVSPADATAVLAGLWLLHGDADASHRCSQSIEDEGRHRCGNFWHGIMHRQEPDYGNSKYWFRRVGQHPIFPELARRADELITADGSESARRWRTKLGTPNGWNASAFVDWCEAAARDANPSQIRLICQVQFVEMHLLLRASYADATRST